MQDALTWFEIATADLERARSFYEAVLNKPLRQHRGDEPMWIFPYDEPRVGGALVHRPQQQPGAGGTMVYLLLDENIDDATKRVAPANGALVVPAFEVPGVPGRIAVIRDTEGNVVGLHGR